VYVCIYIHTYKRMNACMDVSPVRTEVEHSWLRYVMLSWVTL